jgi:pilus assembly protein CpaE
MNDLKRSQHRGFGKRILTDSTAVFRLKDIESQLTEIDHRGQQPTMPPATPAPPTPPAPTARQPRPAQAKEAPTPLVDLSALDESTRTDAAGDVRPGVNAQKIVFFASKGGVGATSVSIQVAGELIGLGHRVCIIDMDLQMGGTAFALGIETNRSLANLAQAVKKGPDAVADFPIAQHSSGIYLLDQPDLAEVEHVGADGLPNVLNALSKTFDYLLIDGLRDFGDHSIVAMDEADRIVMVANDDVPSLRCGLRAADLFRRLGYPADRIKLLLNRNSDQDPSFLEAVTTAFGRSIDWALPEIPNIAHCLNDGLLLRTLAPKDRANHLFANIAREIAGIPPMEAPKRSLIARLFSRKG